MRNNFILGLLFISILLVVWCSTWWKSKQLTWTCIDVTSYDYNRNNDMKCTSSKWEVKYTSYEWAKALMSF